MEHTPKKRPIGLMILGSPEDVAELKGALIVAGILPMPKKLEPQPAEKPNEDVSRFLVLLESVLEASLKENERLLFSLSPRHAGIVLVDHDSKDMDKQLRRLLMMIHDHPVLVVAGESKKLDKELDLRVLEKIVLQLVMEREMIREETRRREERQMIVHLRARESIVDTGFLRKSFKFHEQPKFPKPHHIRLPEHDRMRLKNKQRRFHL